MPGPPVRLMIIDTSPVNSGGAQLLFRYAKYFDPARVHLTMVMHQENAWAERYRESGTAEVLIEPGMFESSTVPPIHELALHKWLARFADAFAGVTPAFLRLARQIVRRRIDVVLGLCDTPATLAALLGTFTSRPAIMHLVSTYVNRFEPAMLSAIGLLPAVRGVVQLSQFSAGQFPLLASKTTAIYSGIDLEDFAHPAQPTLREQYGLAPGTPLVGIAGRFVEIKGMDVFVRAAAHIAARRPDAHFFMLGDDRGEFGERVRRLARELGLADRVSFTGFVDDMHAALADLDVVVVPSRRECAPLVIYEAMALAKPVVASDVHGIPELVEHLGTGLLTPVEDDVALAEAVLELLADPARRRAMGELARRTIDERFNVRVATRQLEEVVVDAARRGAFPWSGRRRAA